ncbi:MAG: secondary thiamine-phosphate synthase enzyme YjbQ [Nitrososphaeria archaeon]|nr:secondary thiamine-phosphate synthase enzyme YjbQ [Conexivisphaerales archaeon]
MIRQSHVYLESKKRRELIDITKEINSLIAGEKGPGLLNIYVPHTTAGLIINENESGLKDDIVNLFEKLAPKNGDYKHNLVDSNADAHLLSIFLKNNASIPFSDGKMMLGTWQSVFLAELDGPRQRQIIITIIS